MDAWHAEPEIVVGKRRRPKRRMYQSRSGRTLTWTVALVVVIGLAAGGYYWFTRPTGLAALPNQAVIAPGGSVAKIDEGNTITVGIEIRNIAEVPLTLTGAEMTPPAGLSLVKISIIPPGPENEGFRLTEDLPDLQSVRLGTDDLDRNAIVAARFKVNCSKLSATDAPAGEQILVTIKVGDEQRIEELAPPVIGEVPWLTATAHRLCNDPLPTGTAGPPEPPLPGASQSPPA